MENKASLPLMELLVMILVFALASALCLGVFARAQSISEATAHRERAAILAQNAAELLKSGGSLESLPLPEGYYVTFQPQQSDLRGITAGMVEAWSTTEKEPLFTLPVAWQEVLP